MKKTLLLSAMTAALTASAPAMAQYGSVLTGETVGAGANILHVQAGFPGISAGFYHGQSESFDLGARFTFNYGMESAPSIIAPGLKPALILKFHLMQQDKFSLALRLEPGLNLYFPFGSVVFGVALPVALDMGIRINDQVAIPIFFEMPMSLNLTPGVSFIIPIKFGSGVEYRLNQDMSLTFAMRFGPLISAGRAAAVTLAFDALFGIAFRL